MFRPVIWPNIKKIQTQLTFDSYDFSNVTLWFALEHLFYGKHHNIFLFSQKILKGTSHAMIIFIIGIIKTKNTFLQKDI